MFKQVKREIKAVGFRVLVKPDPLEDVSTGGIVLVRDEKLYRAATVTGTIVDVGPDAWKSYDEGKPWAKVGDRVYYARYAGKILDDGSEDGLVMLNDEDIQGIIVKEEKVNA